MFTCVVDYSVCWHCLMAPNLFANMETIASESLNLEKGVTLLNLCLDMSSLFPFSSLRPMEEEASLLIKQFCNFLVSMTNWLSAYCSLVSSTLHSFK
ncbi:hypothetical protein MtrunA17_Chr1g0187081 [Medicago truncatula]|uniref:Uncharacterized protein n=1 Tax=Medicago truncatula TaxID=3880 RepID=A0A396JPW5_MEDTR|nr:hypothetical protein MtrunA17_Chr1g0187081 [Medicago truncatula]